MAKISPMMTQYFEIKNEYEHCLLFFRLGDFYEMFFDDAEIASKELGITLTGRDWGQDDRAPMCGVPFHAASGYIAKLVEKGYKVAICEQIEDPKQAKGIVKRKVIRVITPGTVLDNKMLDETKNNYIVCIYSDKTGCGIAACDVSTGEFLTTEFLGVTANEKILDEVTQYSPAEILCNDIFFKNPLTKIIEDHFNLTVHACDDWTFAFSTAESRLCKHFSTANLNGFGLFNKDCCICASGALMEYLYDTQKNGLQHISTIKEYSYCDYMILDATSRKNLELCKTIREKNKKGSLLWVLDKTKTAMGARLLRKWIEKPLMATFDIQKRLDTVEELKSEIFTREEIKEVLTSMYDFERIMGRVIYQNANGKDLIALKNSIQNLPLLKEIIRKCKSPYCKELLEKLDTLDNIYTLIDKAISEDAPFTVREGNMIREGFSSELDMLVNAKNNAAVWIMELENEEKEKTKIKNLKVRENKIFGYYIEVSKSNIKDVPDRYIRKQTLANCERYITPELNDLAELILGSEEKIVALEYTLFTQVREKISEEVLRIQYCAYITSIIDALQSLAEVAGTMGYVKPMIDSCGIIDIKEGRHPVVEKMLSEQFVSNDTFLDKEENLLSIITGPNMAGKSTYMRQVALITLMAQIGSFVPAEYARIGVVDRIFTRVGASDDLSSGQSTFMVEMTEVANILHHATENSLLILDEIGRGTSTFDGLSIAWAVLEYVADKKKIGAKTLFATHYHELTELEGKLKGVKNYSVSIQENGEDILFLRKIVRGGSEHSYGILVARLAGLPMSVIKRSKNILKQLDAVDIAKKSKKIANESREIEEQHGEQIELFSIKETQLADELSKIDVLNLSPIEAIQILFELQKRAK